MTIDPKWTWTDIIASVSLKPCTFEKLFERFDNENADYFIHSVVADNIRNEYMSEDKRGILRATAKGKKKCAERGYNS